MLIGITGLAQSGKDSIGKFLVEEHGFTRFAFADTLKEMALALNPYVESSPAAETSLRLRDQVERVGWENAKMNPEVRRFLQVLGTEGVRDHLGEDSWVKAMDLKLRGFGEWTFKLEANPLGDHSIYSSPNAVITDVRFPNEAEYIWSVGGSVIRVARENMDGTPFDNGIGRDHPSERSVSGLIADFDVVGISGQLDLLYEDVADVLGLAPRPTTWTERAPEFDLPVDVVGREAQLRGRDDV